PRGPRGAGAAPGSARRHGRPAPQPAHLRLPAPARDPALPVALRVGDRGGPGDPRELGGDARERATAGLAAQLPLTVPALPDPRLRVRLPDRRPVPELRR